MKNQPLQSILYWVERFQGFSLQTGKALSDIEASSARVSSLSEHVIREMEFGAEPSGYAALLDGDEKGEVHE